MAIEHAKIVEQDFGESRPIVSTAKRLIDVVGASVLLACSLPVLFVAAILIKLTSRGPVIYRHRRVGLNSVPFSIFKLRTMKPGAEHKNAILWSKENGAFFKVKRDPRLTPCGGLLRKFSIDELPQLINVLKGEMSLVGPRPITEVECKKLGEAISNHRALVLPGLTGLWQVNGRNDTTEEERVRYDIEYVDNWSISMDLKIMLKTIPVVLTGKGAR